jgi:hypothetical protein
MYRKMTALMVLALFAASQSSGEGQMLESAAHLAKGITQVDEGDFSGAVITLDDVIRELSLETNHEKDLATAHLYLAIAHLGLSQWDRAKGEMREAWRSNKDMKLDPRKFVPRVLQLFEAVRAEDKLAEATPKPTPTPSPAATATAQKSAGGHTGLILVGVGGAVVGGVVGGLVARGSTTGPQTNAPTRSSIAFTAVSPPSGSTIDVPLNGIVPRGSGRISIGLTAKLGQDVSFLSIPVYLITDQSGNYCGQNLNDWPTWQALHQGWTTSYTVTGFDTFFFCDVIAIHAFLSNRVPTGLLIPPRGDEILAEATFPVNWHLRAR